MHDRDERTLSHGRHLKANAVAYISCRPCTLSYGMSKSYSPTKQKVQQPPVPIKHAANVTLLCFVLLRSSQLHREENPLQDPQHDVGCPQAEDQEQKN